MTEPVRRSAAAPDRGTGGSRQGAAGAASEDRRGRQGWVVYLVRCADHTLYCGVTNDLTARVAAHGTRRGAKYTRRRGPVELVFARRCRDKRLALRIEYRIKQLTRSQKDELIAKPSRVQTIVRDCRDALVRDRVRPAAGG